MEAQTRKPHLLASVASPFAVPAHTKARYVPRRQRRRLLFDAARRGEVFSSRPAFLVSFAIVFVGLGFGAYYYALWTLTMT